MFKPTKKAQAKTAEQLKLDYHTSKQQEITEKQDVNRALLEKGRGRWGQLRALTNHRKIDVGHTAETSIALTWDPCPSRPHKTVGYRISIQKVGKSGFLPIVEDTGDPATKYTAINLSPGESYKFHIASLAMASSHSKYAGQKLIIPSSSLRTEIIKTAEQEYQHAWFMEEQKEACKIWRCYTGEAKMDFEPNDFKKPITNWIDVSHTSTRCFSGISCMQITYEEGEFGGTTTDVELKGERVNL